MLKRYDYVVTVICLFVVLGAVACSLIWTQPDEEADNAPTAAYEAARLGMVAVKLTKPELVAPICVAAKSVVWPILMSATDGTIGLKDEVVGIFSDVAAHFDAGDVWLTLMEPALRLLEATFDPRVEFKGNWLAVLKGFTGGLIDECDGTEAHKPEVQC